VLPFFALTSALLAADCSRPLLVALPEPNVLALEVPGDNQLWDQIWKKGCNLHPMTARLTMRGTVAGSRTRSAIWVGAHVSGLRIEPADGSRSFVLTSSDRPARVATLELSGRRVESSDVHALVQLAIGLPLTGEELQGLLTTCPLRSGGSPVTLRTGSDALDLMLFDDPGDADVLHFSRRGEHDPWRLLAMTSNRSAPAFRWRTEFHAPVATVPKTFRLTSLDWKGEPGGELDVLVTVDRVQVSPMLEERLFKPSDDKTYTDITIGELKTSGVRLPLVLD